MLDQISYENFDSSVSTTLLRNWNKLVGQAEENEEDKLWVQEVQEEGLCCGWIDPTNAEENPAYLECDPSYTDGCSVFFREEVGSKLGSIQTITLSLSIIQLLIMIATFALICRLKQFYKSEVIDFGDYTHIPMGQIKNLDDLTQRR